MKRTQDLKAKYQLQMDEEGILLAAAHILEGRLQRQGRIHSPDQAGSYLVARCAHLPHEVFGCIFLDSKHHILAIEHLFSGTIDGCDVHPRVVAKRALDLNAVAVILFHNHPNGNPEPSEADCKVTQ
ncbi:DNA repair protein RadC, partial [Xanthomonas perforans]|uniref:JAB domain-containing protein n=1 Tax=Xanthomonas perforans TaxID=442694 RepID=UPI001F1D1A5B